MEDFEKLVAESFQSELIPAESASAPPETTAAAEGAQANESRPEPVQIAQEEKAG
jgi:hypothetical protein